MISTLGIFIHLMAGLLIKHRIFQYDVSGYLHRSIITEWRGGVCKVVCATPPTKSDNQDSVEIWSVKHCFMELFPVAFWEYWGGGSFHSKVWFQGCANWKQLIFNEHMSAKLSQMLRFAGYEYILSHLKLPYGTFVCGKKRKHSTFTSLCTLLKFF